MHTYPATKTKMGSLYTIVLILTLPYLIPAYLSNDSNNMACQLDISHFEGVTVPGDVTIGFLYPLHLAGENLDVTFTERPAKIPCTAFYFQSFWSFQATMFAIEEINDDPNILPNVSLGLQAYDTCNILHLNVKATLQILTGLNMAIPGYRCLLDSPLSAILGPSISTQSMTIAHILGLSRLPQISWWSTSPLLSNRKRFPSFFRTVPSDTFQSSAIAQLVMYFGWSWIGLVASDDDYGQQGIQLIGQEIVKAGACVAFSETILMSKPDRNAPHIVNVIKRSTAKVVVLFCSDVDMALVLDEWLRQNVSKKILIASEAWSTVNLLFFEKYSDILIGTIGLALTSGILPNFEEYLNKITPSMSGSQQWIKLLWENAFKCTFSPTFNSTITLETPERECTGTEKLSNIHNIYTIATLTSSYNVNIAVRALAKALDDLGKCSSGEMSAPSSVCVDGRNFKPWQLLHFLKKVRIKRGNGGEFFFDENGDPPAAYDIVNWQLSPEGGLQHAKVGSYDTMAPSGEIFTINKSAIVWSIEDYQTSVCSENCPPGFRKAIKGGKPVCCHDCLPCPPGEVSNQTNSVACLKCPWDQWPNPQKSGCLPKPIEYLSYEDLLGQTLTAISLVSFLVPITIMKLFVQFKHTPLVKANNYCVSCLLLVSLSLCFLCPLVFIGYPQGQTCLLRQAAFGMAFALCISCILAKTSIVLFAFIATMPDSNFRKWANPKMSYTIIVVSSSLQLALCVVWLCCSPPFPEYNIWTKPGLIVVECNDGSLIAFWTMLGYLFLLATISLIVAFLARRLPDSFNEAQYITFSMLAFLSVWISFIPAYLSAKGKYTVAMEIFAILASSWALVICMFLPKCFIILFRPDKNSREFLIRNHVNKK